MADIVLTGLAANDPTPGEYVEVAFAQGPASLSAGQYKALMIGGMLSTGVGSVNVVYGPDTPVPLTSEDDAAAIFGPRSELRRQARRFLKNNPSTPLYAIAVAENGSATVATGTITITGTATGSGVVRIFVGDEFVDTGFATGDDPTAIATRAIVQVNAKAHWPVIATNAAGVITITSAQKGPRTNLIRYFARIIPFSGTGVTVTPTASTYTSGGAAADDVTSALAVIAAQRYYYYIPAHNDATNLGLIHSQINTLALPTNGLRQRMVWGSIDSLANTITIVNTINGSRSETVWLQDADIPPCEIAAHNAAIYALEEAPTIPLCNFNFYGQGDGQPWQINAPFSGLVPTPSQVKAALNAGISPLGVANGRAYLIKRITNRYLNGSILDYRIRDAHKPTICDRYADDLIAKSAAQLRGKEIGDDPKKNQPDPGPRVVTQRVVKAMVNGLTDLYNSRGLLQNADQIKEQTLVVRDSGNRTRMGAKIPLQTVDVLDQMAFRVDQVA